MKNKPQWLIDAENEMEGFSKAKWSKHTDRQISRILSGALSQKRHDVEYQSEMGKRGGAKGAAVARENTIQKLGYEGYCNLMKENCYDTLTNEKKKEFHSLGGVTQAANKTIARDLLLLPFVDLIPKDIWIEKSEIIKAFENCEVHNAVHKFMSYHKDKFTTNGARGGNVRYQF